MNNDDIIKQKAEQAFDGKGIKKVGIAIDNYKRRSFTRQLKQNKFEIDNIQPFTSGVLIIYLKVKGERMKELKKLCEKMDIDFKLSN